MTAAGTAGRRRTRAMRPWDWALPPRPVSFREIVSADPVQTDPRTNRPPLLMVHGLAHAAWCFAENWVPAAAEAGFPAYALSLRGHGGSAGARHLRRTTMRDYVHDVLQTITELPEPPVLIGHSMGAVIAQLVAERYPLRGLVLLAPAPLHSAAGSMVAIGRERPGDIVRAAVGQTLPMDPDVLFAGLDAATARGYADRTGVESPLVQWELLAPRSIGPVRCPVQVIGTPDDRMVQVADVERTAAGYGVSVRWFPGMGHDLMLDTGWERVLAAVLEFAGGLPPWGRSGR
jgi:pimeloyl-ACP methyl ester carboxylesterase